MFNRLASALGQPADGQYEALPQGPVPDGRSSADRPTGADSPRSSEADRSGEGASSSSRYGERPHSLLSEAERGALSGARRAVLGAQPTLRPILQNKTR